MAKKQNTPTNEAIALSAQSSLAPIPVKQESLFYNVPTSPATDTVLKVLGSGKDNLSTLKSRTKQVNHSQEVEVLQGGDRRQVTIKSNASTVTLELADIEKLTGSNKTSKKLFIFSLMKMNKQAFSDGVLKRDYIQFPLQELQDIGFYSTPQSARKGFKDGMDILTSLKLKGSMKQGKREVATALEVLFTGANIKNGTCTVYLNDRVNWNFIAAYYTLLPDYSFRLSNKAFDLIYYIFYLARQNTRDIESKGYFTISLKALQNHLQLPQESINPTRDIKKPIEDAIAEIMSYSHNTEFLIEPIVDNNAPIAAYLAEGYIKISLSGSYAQNFIELSQARAKQMQAAKHRKEAIQDKAIAINTAKALESKQAKESSKRGKK